MTDKTIENGGKIGSDYFILIYRRKSNKKLEYYLNQFNIDDYWIFKSTRRQSLVSKEELYDFKYSCYIFFKKDKYNKEDILKWIDFTYQFGGIYYLIKPTPPIELIKKINIIK